MNANQDIWNVIYAEILKKYPEPVIDLWLKNFELAYFDSELALITTTSEGFVEILNKKYAPEIAELFETTLGFPLTVKIYAKSKFSLAEALEKPTPTVELPAEPIMPEQPKKAEKPADRKSVV